ncbi:CLUMA_CG004173, isoform A [Clunio marinus]|uniref:CLUMA_CG004173, isoform A n=1 Tax=Clunio marinus TaxID=568069 RepID=A0A1J1HSA5_9DIPT|nr:CLUMA_CG004173, isoform A [Clunio marinus]
MIIDFNFYLTFFRLKGSSTKKEDVCLRRIGT